MSVIEIKRRRFRGQNVNQIILADVCGRQGFASSMLGDVEISVIRGVGKYARSKWSFSEVGWW